jgi:hypothetical protein
MSEHGIGVASMHRLVESDSMDRMLKRAGWSSGMTTAQIASQRDHFMATSRLNGNSPEVLAGTFLNLVKNGLSHQQASNAADAVDQGVTLTGEPSGVVSEALMASVRSFNIALGDNDQGMRSVAKLAVAVNGNRLSLEDIPKILVDIDKKSIQSLGEDQTLALISEFSRRGVPREEVASLTDSIGRVYLDRQANRAADEATGTPWVNSDGTTRALDVILEEVRERYQNFSSEQDREKFLDSSFQDKRTRDAVRQLLSDDGFDGFRHKRDQLRTSLETASAGIASQRESASVVAGRVKNSLTDAVDRIAQPINRYLANAGDFLLDDLNLSGGELIALGLGGSIAGGALSGKAGKLANAIGLPDGVSTMRNAVIGKALERSMGITPVFVTNWPTSNDSGLLGSLASIGGGLLSGLLRGLLRAAVSRVVLALAAVGIAGYAAYSAVNYFSDDEKDASKPRDSPHRRLMGNVQTHKRNGNRAWLMENEFTEEEFQNALLLTPHSSVDPVRDAKKILLRRRVPDAVDLSAFSMLPPLDEYSPTANPIATEAATIAAAAVRDAMSSMVPNPIQIEVHTDVPWLYAEIGDSTRRDARRGE